MRLTFLLFIRFIVVVKSDESFATNEENLELILNEDSLKNFEGSEISLEDNLYCPGIEECPICCPLGHVRDIAGCFTCECRKNGLFAEDIIVTDKGIKELISDVVSILNAKTCIRLVRRTGEHDFIHFYDGGARLCASHVGKAGGPQKIYLGERCMHSGTVAHELMHSLGFDHEQSRPDRDQYVKIFWTNIRRGLTVNFAKKNKNHWYAYDSNYDVDSVMHYSSKQAGMRNGGPTIKTK